MKRGTTGSLTNPSKLARTFKSVKNKAVSDKTLNAYIGYLTDSFLISKAVRFDIKERSISAHPPNIILRTSGCATFR
jgi:predicted AAA+ superfamily ATPase